MNVLLINPSTGYYNRALANPLGLLSIGTHLKNKGHNVTIIDRCINNTPLKNLLSDTAPDVVGISLMSSRGLKDASGVSKFFKKNGVPVAWGGQLPTFESEMILKDCSYVDYLLLNEGEFVFEDLTEVLKGNRKPGDVDNLAYIEDGKIRINKCRPFADLKDMPVLDWSLIEAEKYLQPYLGCQKMMYIYSSKGCPCNCAFCSNPAFHKSILRKRPDEYVIEEIKYLIDNYGMDGVYFSDELWRVKKEDVDNFCRLVHENNLNFHWGVQLRVGLFGYEEFKKMYDAGCRWVLFGVETGNPEMLRKIHKNINIEELKSTTKILRELGITCITSFIIGFPDETPEQVKDTVRLIKSVGANLTPTFHFTPLPGTELFYEVVSSGKYKPPKSLKDEMKVVATESIGQNLSEIPTRDLKVIRCTLHWQSFSRKDALASSGKFEFAKQTIKSGLNAISKKGIISFFLDGFLAFREFSQVFLYSHLFPDIRKKYELD